MICTNEFVWWDLYSPPQWSIRRNSRAELSTRLIALIFMRLDLKKNIWHSGLDNSYKQITMVWDKKHATLLVWQLLKVVATIQYNSFGIL